MSELLLNSDLVSLLSSGRNLYIVLHNVKETTAILEIINFNETMHSYFLMRAIALVVSSWISTAAPWVRARASSCGICGGQSGT
jgi:hypothetical protein